MSLIGTEAAIKGMVAATWLMEAGLLGVLGVLGAAVGAISFFASVMDSTYNSTDELNERLSKTKEGFVELSKPIDKATIAMQNYNQAVKDYYSKQSAIERITYHEERNKRLGRTDTWGDFFRMIPDIFRAGNFKLGEMPQKEFFDLTESGEFKEYRPNLSQNVNLKAAPIEVILKDQKGNVIGSNTANLIPTLQSTF